MQYKFNQILLFWKCLFCYLKVFFLDKHLDWWLFSFSTVKIIQLSALLHCCFSKLSPRFTKWYLLNHSLNLCGCFLSVYKLILLRSLEVIHSRPHSLLTLFTPVCLYDLSQLFIMNRPGTALFFVFTNGTNIHLLAQARNLNHSLVSFPTPLVNSSWVLSVLLSMYFKSIQFLASQF